MNPFLLYFLCRIVLCGGWGIPGEVRNKNTHED